MNVSEVSFNAATDESRRDQSIRRLKSEGGTRHSTFGVFEDNLGALHTLPAPDAAAKVEGVVHGGK